VAEAIKAFAALHDFAAVVPTCAKSGKLVDAVLEECDKLLGESEWFFPEDMMTDQPERQMAAEIIREKLLRTLNKEVPHGVAVVIEEFKDEGSLIRIRAEIFCEKASHKGIIVGKGGVELKRVGTYAREDLEKLFGTKVFLNLWVKVKENWRESRAAVGNFGYREEK
jgi:GTP-binding protein Era